MKNYRILGPDNKTIFSEKKGKFGGHNKLKIFGKLDCKSAISWINRGEYAKYRVFFHEYEHAIAAGFRPCKKCKPEK